MSTELEQAEARELGWAPKEEWKGDPERWKDADQFLEHGRTVMPILKKNNERLMETISELRGETATVKEQLHEAVEAIQAFKEFHEEDRKRQFEHALRKLKADKLQAMEDGDHKAVIEIDEALQILHEESVAPAKPSQKAGETEEPAKPAAPVDFTKDPVFVAWKEKNPWLDTDDIRTPYAVQQAVFIQKTQGLKGPALLEAVSRAVENRFGAYKPGGGTSKVEASGGGGGNSPKGKPSYSDLDADSKAACERYVKKLVGPNKAWKSVEEYRQHYAESVLGSGE